MNLENTLVAALGIEITHAADGKVEATMPVDHRTVQPAGFLHGGATAALIETACSLGSFVLSDKENEHTFGIEINVNHLKSTREGTVFCTAVILSKGRSLHVWNAEVRDESGALIAVGRLTVMVVPKKKDLI
jgi:1,4-dihydroxy-2-naphthoyl-CoA hydrolase